MSRVYEPVLSALMLFGLFWWSRIVSAEGGPLLFSSRPVEPEASWERVLILMVLTLAWIALVTLTALRDDYPGHRGD